MTTSSNDSTPERLQLGQPLRVATLATRKPTRFRIEANADQREAAAAILGITAISRLRFAGEIRPRGRNDWDLVADLEAEVEQPCSVTLAPVITKIHESVERHYLADMPVPEGDEVEMPEDDRDEPLPEVIDPGSVALEALALALPAYPRADGATLGEAVFAAQGVAPLRDEDLRPFSGLASLAERLKSGQKDAE
ncbi:MAG TPA: YceD family protein [Gemmobacter sp.]|nr:YceD family protein [Gemmobacter sp.]